ncbi:MAG: antitoxin VapB family protein [Candidatus Micrarchaeota archaeon]
MSYKTISVPTDVYEMLSTIKGKESFGAFFRKMVTRRKTKVIDSFGKWVMSPEEERKISKEINKLWGEWDESAGHGFAGSGASGKGRRKKGA